MNVAQLIAIKRDGDALTEEQIKSLVQGYTDESVPDYQMAAFAMAVFFQGMTPKRRPRSPKPWLIRASE